MKNSLSVTANQASFSLSLDAYLDAASQAATLTEPEEAPSPLDLEEIAELEHALKARKRRRHKHRRLPAEPSNAVTREAIIAVYTERLARGEHLYHPQDAWRLIDRHTLDQRICAMEEERLGEDGRKHIVERAVMIDSNGEIVPL